MIRIPFASSKAKITSKYGERVLWGVKEFHHGLDMVGISDYTVVSATDGIVEQSRIITDKSNRTWEFGNYVCIRTPDNKLIYYCHLRSRAVKVGDKVRAGDTIGVMGSTGNVTGAHLHFEVREGSKAINPAIYLGIPNSMGTINTSRYSKALWKLTIRRFILTPESWEKYEKDTRVHDIMIRLEAAFPIAVTLEDPAYDKAAKLSIKEAIDILYNEGVIMDKAFWMVNHVNYPYIDLLFKRVAYALDKLI